MSEKVSVSLTDRFGKFAYRLIASMSPSSPYLETELGEKADKFIAACPTPINQLAGHLEETSLREKLGLVTDINDYFSIDLALRKEFLKAVFRDRDSLMHYTSSSFLSDMSNMRGVVSEGPTLLDRCLSHPLLPQLLPIVGEKDTTRARSITALLLSKSSASALPEQVKDRLGVKEAANDVKIIPGNGYMNCSDSEPRMRRSVIRGDTTLVNGHLLVKGYGYNTALCLETTATRHSTFYEGSWYTPQDYMSKHKVEQALRYKDSEITLDEGEWVFIRDTSIFLDPDERIDLLNQAKNAVGMR